MGKPPSPFSGNPHRYRNVPKRVKNPKTQSGCLAVPSAVAALAVFCLLSAAVWVI